MYKPEYIIPEYCQHIAINISIVRLAARPIAAPWLPRIDWWDEPMPPMALDGVNP